MTVAQANAINRLIRRLLPHAAVLDDDARQALEVLATGAYKRLYAGYSPQMLRDAWGQADAEQPTS